MTSLQAQLDQHGVLAVDGAVLCVSDLLSPVFAGFPSPAEDLGAQRIDCQIALRDSKSLTLATTNTALRIALNHRCALA